MNKKPYCKECKILLKYDGPARMGSFHSNWYKCPSCKKVVEIYDCDLNTEKEYFV